MGKKKKKTKDGDSKPLFSKKRRRGLIRLILLAIIGYVLYALYNPAIISNAQLQSQVLQFRTKLLSSSFTGQTQLVDFLNDHQSLSFFNRYLPQGAVLGDQEIKVEDLLNQATSELKKLPASQVERLKADFCATPTPEPTPAQDF